MFYLVCDSRTLSNMRLDWLHSFLWALSFRAWDERVTRARLQSFFSVPYVVFFRGCILDFCPSLIVSDLTDSDKFTRHHTLTSHWYWSFFSDPRLSFYIFSKKNFVFWMVGGKLLLFSYYSSCLSSCHWHFTLEHHHESLTDNYCSCEISLFMQRTCPMISRDSCKKSGSCCPAAFTCFPHIVDT